MAEKLVFLPSFVFYLSPCPAWGVGVFGVIRIG